MFKPSISVPMERTSICLTKRLTVFCWCSKSRRLFAGLRSCLFWPSEGGIGASDTDHTLQPQPRNEVLHQYFAT